MSSSVNWGQYQLFEVITPTRPEDDTRDGARAQFDSWLRQKPERRREFERLLELNEVPTGSDDASIQAITDWYINNVEAEDPPIPEAPGMLQARWYSVAIDLAIYLGDIIIERVPTLEWTFFTPDDPHLSGYQKPVVSGFTNGTGKVDDSIAFDLQSAAGQVGHGVVLGAPLLDRNKRFMLHTIELAEEYQ